MIGKRPERKGTRPIPISSKTTMDRALLPSPRGYLRQTANRVGVIRAHGRKVAKQNAMALAKVRSDGSGLVASAAAGPHASAMQDHANAIHMRGIRYVGLVNDSMRGE